MKRYGSLDTFNHELSERPAHPGNGLLAGTVGTFACFIVSLATDLSPILVIAKGGGPIEVILHDSQISAKCARSERKPCLG